MTSSPTIAAAAALAAGIALTGCDPDRGEPFIDFDTRTNIITIDAPIDEKHRTETEGYRGTFRFVFNFEIKNGSHTDSSAVWVSREVYNAYDEGDRLRLRCVPAEPCGVIR